MSLFKKKLFFPKLEIFPWRLTSRVWLVGCSAGPRASAFGDDFVSRQPGGPQLGLVVSEFSKGTPPQNAPGNKFRFRNYTNLHR